MSAPGDRPPLAFLIVAAVLIVLLVASARGAAAHDGFRGPYNMQLYDSPHYYPFYAAQAANRGNARCATVARPDGFATVCR